MLRTCAIALASVVFLAGPVQTQSPQPQSPVLTIDQDRLFLETRFGARSTEEIEADALALAEENRRIEEQLVIEERELTEQREGLTPEDFTELADAFDARVQQIRVEQDAKARALAARQEDARQRFFGEIGGILSDIVRERGADVLLDRRNVFLSADRVDITDEAIARINAEAGEPDQDSADDQ